MTARLSPADAAHRGLGQAARGTIKKVDNSKKIQEIDVELLKDEVRTGIEVFSQYGFSSVPKKGAQVAVLFMGGARSHGIAVAIDDGSSRPTDLVEGEVGLKDDQGQSIQLKRDGIKVSGGASKKPVTVDVGTASFKVEDGKITLSVGSSSLTMEDGKIVLTATDTYLIGNVAAGVAAETKPVKVRTATNGTALRFWTE